MVRRDFGFSSTGFRQDDDLWMAEYGKVPTKPWRGGGVSARVMRREDRFVKGPMRWKPQKAWRLVSELGDRRK